MSLPLEIGPERTPRVLHVVPVCGTAQDVFVGALSLLVVSSPEAARWPQPEMLEALFDLTRAEARLAHLLVT